jgi:hypothetical protein
MRNLALVIVVLVGCKKENASTGSGAASGSAATVGSVGSAGSAAVTETPPPEDVSCQVAAKAYARKMGATPGNLLSDAKPDEGLIYYTAVSMEDYCDGEGGMVVAWTAQERACVKNAQDSAVSGCFTGAALAQVNAGLAEVVGSALANRKANEAAAGSAGSAGSAVPVEK